MKKVKVGVVGVGHLGQHHARIYSQMAGAELVGIVDVDEERARKISQEQRTVPYRDYSQILDKVEAVSIAVPTFSHYEVARGFLEKKVHVLIEKPITPTIGEAEELFRLARQNNLILQVGHIERFNAAIRELEKRVANPRFIESHRLGPFKERATDVGVVLDLMIHDIDIILTLVKSKISRLDASGTPVLSRKEDIANARLKFENGCVANITASRLTREEMRRIRVFQKDAYISLDFPKQELVIYRKVTRPRKEIIVEKPKIAKGEPLKKELESFVECIREGKKPLVSEEEVKKALGIVTRILGEINNE